MNLTKHLLKSNRNCVAKNRVKTILVSAHQSGMEAPDLSQNLGAMMLSQNRWHNQCISMAGVWFVMVSLFWNLWSCTNCRHCFALAFPAWRCLTSGRFTQQATCRRAAWKAARKPQTANRMSSRWVRILLFPPSKKWIEREILKNWRGHYLWSPHLDFEWIDPGPTVPRCGVVENS